MVDIYICKMKSKFNMDIDSICLSDVIRRKVRSIDRYHNVQKVHQSIIGEILARIAICSRLLLKNSHVVLYRNEFNKPLLQNPTDYFFNISHSGDWVVCASGFHSIGIDIEQIKHIDYRIGESIFSKQEYELLNHKNEFDKVLWFYKLWTMKESYVKAIGKGLYMRLNQFSINTQNHRDFYVDGDSIHPKAYFHEHIVDLSHVMTLCTFNEEKSIQIYDLSDLLVDLIHRLNTPSELQEYINRTLISP